MSRVDGRKNDQLRPIKITEDFVSTAEASYLVEVGKTRILCCASLEEEIPRWLKGKNKGWVTAEYNLLPRSTTTRVKRERSGASGRTQEIQRLIGRALRGVCNLEAMGERSFVVDCDVIEADGGTRTASIVGGFMALAKALQRMKASLPPSAAAIAPTPPILRHFVSAVSVGIVEGVPMLDLCYAEDSEAEVDMNIVRTDTGHFVEVQGTGEEAVYSRAQLNEMLDLAEKGCGELVTLQKRYLGTALP
ncbi:MAG TPA: ribonuclease PH [Fibrobacteria bacterium]|nr:ribonuclease PH [Fibrobacteria bacterium]